ncbi:MAG: ATP-binding protein [Rhodospirillaceae bacterium]
MRAQQKAEVALPAKAAIRLLLVENDQADADCFENSLHDSNHQAFSISRATTLDAAQQAVAEVSFDVVVLDLDLPDSQGLDTLVQFRVDVTDSVPIFVLTGVNDETDVDEIVFRSGNEYLIKGRLDHSLLPRLLRHAVEKQRSHISMRKLITTNPDGIVVVDFDGVVLFANTMAAELFNRTPGDLVGHSFGFPVIAGVSADINTLTNRAAEMRSVEIDWSGLPAFLVSLRDVTERLTMVRDLRMAKEQAELANRVRDEILANMNHEVRTPLNSIIGFSDLLLTGDQGGSDPETVRSYLGNINQSGWQLLELLNDVLDMANIRANHFELEETNFDLGRTVDAVVQLMRSQIVRAGLTLEVSLPPAALRLHGDQRRVKQMLGHLFSNAVKFNRRGGSIHLVVSTNDLGDVLLTVADTGVGMDPERIAAAEAAFGRLDGSYSCSTGGMGLGLSLTKGMIERHGGRLLIESTPGVGSAITISLPAFRVIHGDMTG